MSKNVKIKEGTVSKVFNNVEKIVTNDTSNGTDTWIPEDEANDYASTTELNVTKNGTYEAPTAGVVGYRKVTVNVPSTLGTIDEGDLVENLITNTSNFILHPKIYNTSSGWEWVGGRTEGEPNRSFTTTNTSEIKDNVNIYENHVRLYQTPLIVPESYQDIPESDTALVFVNDKQLYFVSISDFSAGITTHSPREYNKTITPYIEDMYKCRRLKYAEGGSQIIADLFSNSGLTHDGDDTVITTNTRLTLNRASFSYTESATEKMMSVSFINATGNNYGLRVIENKTTGVVSVKNIRNNLLFDDIIGRFYDTEAQAQADIGVVPADTIAFIRGRS